MAAEPESGLPEPPALGTVRLTLDELAQGAPIPISAPVEVPAAPPAPVPPVVVSAVDEEPPRAAESPVEPMPPLAIVHPSLDEPPPSEPAGAGAEPSVVPSTAGDVEAAVGEVVAAPEPPAVFLTPSTEGFEPERAAADAAGEEQEAGQDLAGEAREVAEAQPPPFPEYAQTEASAGNRSEPRRADGRGTPAYGVGPNWMLAFVCGWAGGGSLLRTLDTLGRTDLSGLNRLYALGGFSALGVGLIAFAVEALFWHRFRRRNGLRAGLLVLLLLITLAGVAGLILFKDPDPVRGRI